MLAGVFPILITVPFDGTNAAVDRKRFIDNLTYRIEFATDNQGPFYEQLQYHAFETTIPVKGMQLYDTLQREINLFPNYIEDQRNINGLLLTSNSIRDPDRMAGLEPPLPYSATVNTGRGDEYKLEWNSHQRLALVADDSKIYESKKEEYIIGEIDMMTIVVIQVDEYNLTNEEEDEEYEKYKPDAGHNFAAKLFQQTPQWCSERGIQAMQIRADHIEETLACIETGELYFHEMAQAEEDWMTGTEHDDIHPLLSD